MALYTFYPCKSDGTSGTFTSFDLQDDAAAYVRAMQVLTDHRSCTDVVVWAGARRVTSRHRLESELQATLSRPGAP